MEYIINDQWLLLLLFLISMELIHRLVDIDSHIFEDETEVPHHFLVIPAFLHLSALMQISHELYQLVILQAIQIQHQQDFIMMLLLLPLLDHQYIILLMIEAITLQILR